MPTFQEELDQMRAMQGGAGEDEGMLDAVKNDLLKSMRAAGMVVGIYKPETQQEAGELRKRFTADVALLGASALTGGTFGAVAKAGMLGTRLVGKSAAKAILGGALTNAVGMATHAGIEGGSPVAGAVTGAVLGAGFGLAGAGVGAIRKGLKAGAEAFVADEAAPVAAAVAKPLSTRETVLARRAAARGDVLAAEEIRAGQLRAVDPEEIRRGQLQALYEQPKVSPWNAEAAQLAPEDAAFREIMNPFEPPIKLEPAPFESSLRSGPAPFESSYVPTTMRPIGERLRALEAAPPGLPGPLGRPRDARGRFTVQKLVEGTAPQVADLGASREINAELIALAREAIGDVNASKVLPRLPRNQRGFRGARMGARPRSITEASVVESMERGSPDEIVNLALNNSLTRRVLMKLGTKVEKFGERRGRDWNLAAPLDKLYNDVANGARRVLMPVESALARMGTSGAMLGTEMSGTLDRAMRLAANDIESMHGLAKMTPKDRTNVSHVLNGDAVPANQAVAEMATLIRSLLDKLGIEAKNVKLNVYSPRMGQKRPFTLHENYFPLEYSPKSIAKYTRPGPEREEALRIIMRSEQGMSRKEAEAVLNRYLHPHLSEFRYGHLQMARDMVLPGWEEDPLKVLPQYFLRGWKRVETARTFGNEDQLMYKLAGQLGKEGYDENYALEAYRAFADKAPLQLHDLAGATRTLNMISLLSTTGLVQLAQHSNIIALTGWKNYIQGLGAAFSRQPVTKEWAARTGAYLQEYMQDLVAFGSQGLGSKWAKVIGLEQMDKANRIIAAIAGRFHADDIAAKYVKETAPKALQALERQLTQLKLSPAEVRAAGGVLTTEQRSIAGQQASLLTQFRGSVLDMPLARHSPAGQFIYLFKNFSIQQTRFVSRLMQDAREGNTTPLVRYLTATGTMTAATGYAINGVKYGGSLGGMEIPGLMHADLKPERLDIPINEIGSKEWLFQYLEWQAMAGAVGIASDGLRGVTNGPEMLRSFLLGPTANDVLGLMGRDLPEFVKGNPRQILHDFIKHWPLLGRRLADHLVPLEE